MRTIVQTFAIMTALSFMAASPTIEARDSAPRVASRGESRSVSTPRITTGKSTAAPAARPSTGAQTSRPTTGNASRPGATGPQATRPGSSTQTRPQTGPGNNPGKGNSTPQRPGNGPTTAPGGPGATPRPGAGPAMRPPTMTPAPRPHRPTPPASYARPMPPAAWRPGSGAPTIHGILGITFGTGFNLSLDYLYGAGYNIAGYGNNAVYLTDINVLNYIWPDGTLFYSGGGLAYSQFYYSTAYYDPARYNAVRSRMISTYGLPVTTTVLPGGGYQTTWFGYNNTYVTLTFNASSSIGGGIRYYTILTYGN